MRCQNRPKPPKNVLIRPKTQKKILPNAQNLPKDSKCSIFFEAISPGGSAARPPLPRRPPHGHRRADTAPLRSRPKTFLRVQVLRSTFNLKLLYLYKHWERRLRPPSPPFPKRPKTAPNLGSTTSETSKTSAIFCLSHRHSCQSMPPPPPPPWRRRPQLPGEATHRTAW